MPVNVDPPRLPPVAMGVQACDRCGVQTEVFDSRPRDRYVWRRRHCDSCGNRFTTVEIRRDEFVAIRRVLDGLDRVAAAVAIAQKVVDGTADDPSRREDGDESA